MVLIEELENKNPEVNQTSHINSYISVPDFYAERSVFITGGTGFLGKVLIEKLLRSCPKIENIYMLIREKRGQSIENRMNDFFKTPVFEKVRQENAFCVKKIIPITGDVLLDKLGISENDQELLCRTVSIVFHGAASVKMNENLKVSIAMNTQGTKRVVDLCKKMKLLQALVYISTAYSHSDRSVVDEKTYPPPYNPNNIISLTEWLPEEALDNLTPFFLGKKPNTYVFCKSLAENIIEEEARDLPRVIVRPSMVVSSHKEPLPGWVDNAYGPIGCMILNALGLIRIYCAASSKVMDVIPVDIVTNLIIVSAWRTATSSEKNLMVYNCISGNLNKKSWYTLNNFFVKHVKNYPPETLFWYPLTFFIHKNPFYDISAFFIEVIPIYLLDFILWITKGKKMFIKIYQKYRTLLPVLTPFSQNEWTFYDNNVLNVYNMLSNEDKKLFYCDIAQIPWDDYVEVLVKGMRKYMLKQNEDTLQSSRRKLKMLYWVHVTFICGLVIALFYILSFLF